MIFSNEIIAQIDIQDIVNRNDTVQDMHKKASTLLFLAEYYIQNQPDSAIIYANQALEIAYDHNDSSAMCVAYRHLSVSYGEKREFDLSEAYFIYGLPFARTAKDSADFYADMGTVYTMSGNLQKAGKSHSIAKNIFTRISDTNNLARLITNMGVMHSHNADYYQASECFLEALEICEQINDEVSLALIYQNIGELMALQNQYDKAVGYYNSSLNLFEKLEQFPDVSAVFLNLGQIYIEQNQWDVAKHYLNKSYIIDTTFKLKNHESIALKLLGITYLRVNRLESAERLISEALRIQNENSYKSLIGETTTILAEVYFEKGNYIEALELLNSVESETEISGDDNLLSKILSLKSSSLAKLNKFDSAYFTLKNSNKISDSIFNIKKSKSIMNLELAYQTEKKEKQIDELKYNDLIYQEQLKNKMTQVYLLIVSVVLLVVILVFLLFFIKRRHQNENKNRERRFLQGRFEAEEKAKDKIAIELHDDIGGRLIGIILQLQSSQNLTDSELKLLQDVYRDVRRLSHSLDEPLFTEITLQEKVRNYLSELKEHVNFKSQFIDDISYNWKTIESQQELQRNIYRIVQELITNTIKYADATEVEIQMMNEDKSFVMIYEDDGVGMTEEELDNNLSFNTIRKRIEMFDGNFEINSNSGKGVFVIISIPIQIKK